MDIPWGWVAAAPRVPRGHSVGTNRGETAATTWTFRGDEPRRRRGGAVPSKAPVAERISRRRRGDADVAATRTSRDAARPPRSAKASKTASETLAAEMSCSRKNAASVALDPATNSMTNKPLALRPRKTRGVVTTGKSSNMKPSRFRVFAPGSGRALAKNAPIFSHCRASFWKSSSCSIDLREKILFAASARGASSSFRSARGASSS